MSGHTKGPWLYRGKSDSVHMPDAEYPYGKQIFQFRDECSPSDADLTLVLASPDLLDALIDLVDDISDRFDMDSPSTNPGIKIYVERARSAIAKATTIQ
jgi:hypothetical protein